MKTTSEYSRRALLALCAAAGGAMLAGCDRTTATEAATDEAAAARPPSKAGSGLPKTRMEIEMTRIIAFAIAAAPTAALTGCGD